MNRYLFYADFLGTKDRYREAGTVQRVRELLEIIVQAYFGQGLMDDDFYIYIFSDSLFVTCPRVQPLLHPAAKLFRQCLSTAPSIPTESLGIHLLRGAIAYGEGVTTSVTANSSRIMVIPLLDTSLVKATTLEKIRPGSRVYLDQDSAREAAITHEHHLYHWQQITGKGPYFGRATEFLWPSVAYDTCRELVQSAERIWGKWLSLLGSRKWADDYAEGLMIQLDETLKVLIRSVPHREDKLEARDFLLKILPESEADKTDAAFAWGMWFQVFKALIECLPQQETDWELVKRLEIVKGILSRTDGPNKELLWEHFLGELEKPDYAAFRKSVSSLL